MAYRALPVLAGLAFLGFAGFLLFTQPRPSSLDDLQGVTGDTGRGQMVFTAAGCASCHMAPGAEGTAQLVLSGGMGLASPFGTFRAPNISPDPVQGIGNWTLEQFAHALRDGISPAGQHYFPALPYNAYNKMTGQDLADLWAYLQSLPPAIRAHAPDAAGMLAELRDRYGSG